MKIRFFALAFLTPFFAYSQAIDSEELTIDLKNPQFLDGHLFTDEGGVVVGKDLRIQAQKISYHTTVSDGIPQRVVKASGDLFVVFKDKPFVAESIVYDFAKGQGTLYDGRTYVDLWYLGGKELILNPDGSFEARNAFITTSANRNSAWEFHSSSMKVNKKRSLSVKNLSLRLFRIPVFWMPTFKASMRFLKDPLIKYKVTWDKNIGPRFTARYQFLATDRFDMYIRSDTRVTAGPDHSIKAAFGGAIETIYKDPEDQTQFLTRSFYANDKIVPIEKGPHRYRFQGLIKNVSDDDSSIFYLSYDKLSDQSMISDFKSDDFVVNTEKRSYLYYGKQASDVLFRLSVQPCLNRFQSITEEYPNVIINLRSQDLGKSGIIANSDSRLGYLNYKYARGLREYFQAYHSYRMQTVNEVYRPFSLRGFNITPKAGAVGIYYTNSPENATIGQLSYHYGLDSNIRFASSQTSFSHVIEPYFNYNGYSKPSVGPDSVYYFYLDDGISKLNTIQTGLRQSVRWGLDRRQILFDAFVLSFCQGFNYPQVVGRYGANLEMIFSRFFIKAYALYNVGASRLDYINTQGSFTISKDFALFLEYRNRGPYAWRKSDYENYFLDVARPDAELIETPISDKRQTILGKISLRLSPRVTTMIGGHYGFGRKTEPSYKSTKIELNLSIGGSWNLKIGYHHSPDNDRFTTNFYLSQ